MGDVSTNFSYSEFVVSKDYPALAAQITLTLQDRAKVKYMVRHFLQPLRIATGAKISLLSSKRSPELNKNVGGTTNSDHMFKGNYACACDIYLEALVSGGWAAENVIEWFKQKGGFKQLVWYSSQLFFHLAPWGLTTKESQVLIR